MREKRKARIFIIDSNRLFIEAFLFLCHQDEDISVVGFSLSGNDFWPALLEAKPNLVIMDIEPTDFEKLCLLRALTRRLDDIKIIVFSLHNAPDLAQKALRNRASAFLVKGTPARRILETVRQLMSV
jgi:DNA-binding NarL/FixJ family response regulator